MKEINEPILGAGKDESHTDTESDVEDDVLFSKEKLHPSVANGSSHIPEYNSKSNDETKPEFTSEKSEEDDEEDFKKPKEQEVEFHQLLKDYVGEFGCYQILFTAHKCWTTCFAAIYTFLPVFIAAIPDHRCDIPMNGLNCTDKQIVSFLIPTEIRHGENVPSQCEYYDVYNNTDVISNDVANESATQSIGNCDFKNFSGILPVEKCDKWIYNTSSYESTIIDEWDIVCSRAYLSAHANSVYWVGVIVGLLFGGHLADRWGRKPVGVLGYIFFLLFGMASTFSPNYMVFLVLRFLSSIFKTIKEIGEGISSLETIGETWRIVYFVTDHIGWCVGYFLMDLLAYYERRWRYLQAYITLSDIPAFLLFVFYFKESPRWLLTQDRQDEALRQLRLIAARNFRKLPPTVTLKPHKEIIKVSAIELFRWPNMRKVTLILFCCWFSMGLIYYGISLHTGHLGGNPFVTFLISGTTDLFSGFLALGLMHKFGRILPYSIGYFLGGLALVISIFAPTDISWVIITTAMVGKFLVNIPGTGTWLYTLETYPTSIRSIGVHMCSLVARLGAVCASYIGVLAHINRALPLLVFGACGLIAGFVSLMLPETKNEALKQTVQEGELFMKRKLCASFPCGRRILGYRDQSYKLNIPTSAADIAEQEEALLTSTEEEEF